MTSSSLGAGRSPESKGARFDSLSDEEHPPFAHGDA